MPEVRWNTLEVNVRGVFDFFRCAFVAATTLYLTSGRADWLSGRYHGDPVVAHLYLVVSRLTPARYYSANWERRRGGVGLERRDIRAAGAREQAECSQALVTLRA